MEKPAGRIIFNVYKDMPKTAENFYKLCTGEEGENKNGVTLHYKGLLFHRIVGKVLA